jgi:hypothetical protein
LVCVNSFEQQPELAPDARQRFDPLIIMERRRRDHDFD